MPTGVYVRKNAVEDRLKAGMAAEHAADCARQDLNPQPPADCTLPVPPFLQIRKYGEVFGIGLYDANHGHFRYAPLSASKIVQALSDAA